MDFIDATKLNLTLLNIFPIEKSYTRDRTTFRMCENGYWHIAS